MSGIYIKGMEMPESCWDCYFQDCGNCVLNAHKVVDKCIIEGRRDDDCPLIPVPNHGRLIDADALMEQVKHDTPLSAVFEKTMRWYLNNAPTIIPATFENLPKSKDSQKIEEGET